jgi:hypothetical protein
MTLSERQWCGVSAVELLFQILFANAIRVSPQTPYDIYMGQLRHANSDVRRDAHTRAHTLVNDIAGDVAPSEMDRVLREQCGFSVAAIYCLHSKINHACDFNCQVEPYHFDNCLIQVVATTSIKAGGDLCTSYVDPGLPADERNDLLVTSHHFHCDCRRCSNNEHMLASGIWQRSRARPSLGMGVTGARSRQLDDQFTNVLPTPADRASRSNKASGSAELRFIRKRIG